TASAASAIRRRRRGWSFGASGRPCGGGCALSAGGRWGLRFPARLAQTTISSVRDSDERRCMSTAVEASTDVRAFQVDIPAEKVDDVRRRIGATRWPSKELVADRKQGVQLEALQALARYWLDEYDFGRVQARLNALPQFVTTIDGVDIHFIHAKS